MNSAEPDIPPDLADRVDRAMQALRRGDSAEFERLLELEVGEGAGIGELLQPVLQRRQVPVIGLTDQSQVGGYKIIREIGRGGMGVVYEAEQQEPRRRVALKVLPRLAADERVKLFRKEIQAQALLRHPGIATIYEAGQTQDGQHFFTMELVTGTPLSTWVKSVGSEPEAQARAPSEPGAPATGPARRPVAEILRLFVKICAAVAYAHTRGVIHRDLKPSNIMVDLEGNVRVLDFGLARIIDPDATETLLQTKTGVGMGTLEYMSPEQASGKRGATDARSDVYALGVILSELLTGQKPYDVRQDTRPATQVICEQPPRRPSAINPALRGDLETIVLKALEKERARRYPSVAEFAGDVQCYLEGEPIHARAPSRLYGLRKRIARHRLAFGLTIAAVVLAAGGLNTYLELRAREIRSIREGVLVAQRDLEAGNLDLLSSTAKIVHESPPRLPEALLVRAQAEFRKGQRDHDQRLYNYAAQDLCQYGRPPYQWAAELLSAEIEAKGVGKTQSLLERRPAEMPDTADAWYVASFATLDSHEAQCRAKSAVDRNPRHEFAWLRLAYLYALHGDADAAEKAAQRLIDLGRDPLRWRMFCAFAFACQGRCREARDRCGQVAVIPVTRPDAHVCRAAARLCVKDYSGARDDFSDALRAGTDYNGWWRFRRATALWALRAYDEATADYRSVLKFQTPSTYAAARLCLLLREQAQLARQAGDSQLANEYDREADDTLKAAVQSASPGSWMEKILQCLDGKRAPADLVAAADRNLPEQVCEGSYYAGEVCLLAGDTEAARGWFERCVQTGLLFTPGEYGSSAMNEYHLAVWRRDQLGPAQPVTSSPAD